MSRLVPKLRFKEFSGEWNKKPINKILTIGSGKDYKHLSSGDIPVYGTGGYMLSVNDYLYDRESVCIGRKGTIDKPMLLTGKFWTVDTLFYTHSFKNNIPKFIYALFLKINWYKYNEASGVPSLSKVTIGKIDIFIPPPKEQQKIASCLSSLDALIEAQNKKVSVLKQHKKGLMQQLFPAEGKREPKLRFKAFSGEWVEKKLGECLGYLQPTKYLVSDTNYNDDYDTPVLTAGKTFILGYTNEKSGIFKNNLPVIIFDDFTTATKYVDFPFKAKSSAMKILLAKESMNIKFMYELMQMIKYEVGNHERHWISKFALLDVLIPTPKEQQKIANTLSTLDNLIEAQDQKITQLKQHKKGLMQQLFVSSEVAHE